MKNAIILLILSILLIGCSSVSVQEEVKQNNISDLNNLNNKLEPTEENFLRILKTNKDGEDYLKKYPNTKVVRIEKIVPEDFERLKNETDYKKLYEGLPKKELYRVDFNGGTQLSLLTVIDLENEKVVKIFGSFIMGLEAK